MSGRSRVAEPRQKPDGTLIEPVEFPMFLGFGTRLSGSKASGSGLEEWGFKVTGLGLRV